MLTGYRHGKQEYVEKFSNAGMNCFKSVFYSKFCFQQVLLRYFIVNGHPELTLKMYFMVLAISSKKKASHEDLVRIKEVRGVSRKRVQIQGMKLEKLSEKQNFHEEKPTNNKKSIISSRKGILELPLLRGKILREISGVGPRFSQGRSAL